MYAKRIIPCLDVKNGRVVKGVSFVDLRDAGDPVECASAYDKQGADELVLLDITATHEGRNTMIDIVKRVADTVFIPFTVGGGIRTIDDFKDLLRAGADKISVNSAAVRNPDLINEAAYKFGAQCVVCAIDACHVPCVASTTCHYNALTWITVQETCLVPHRWQRTDEVLNLLWLCKIALRTVCPVQQSGLKEHW